MTPRSIAARHILSLAALVLAVGACEVRTHLLIDASDLSAGNVTAVVGFDDEFRRVMEDSGGEGDVLAELESSAEAEGWQAEAFIDSDVEGYRLSRSFKSVAELSELFASSMLSEDWGYTDIRFAEEDGEFVFEANGGNPLADFSGEEGFEQVAEFLTIDFQLAVTFPGAVKEHNGILSERTVTWALEDLESETGRLYGRSAIGSGFPWALAGGLVLGLIVAGAVAWRLRSPISNIPTPESEDQAPIPSI